MHGSYLAAAEYACDVASADTLHEERQALALFQHHDGITGTAKSNVVQDYFQTMQHAIDSLHHKIGTCLGVSSTGAWAALRGGGSGGKLAFNPTGMSRDGLAAWEVKALPAPAADGGCAPKAVNARTDNLSPTRRLAVGRDGLVSAIDGRVVFETVVWYENKVRASLPILPRAWVRVTCVQACEPVCLPTCVGDISACALALLACCCVLPARWQ